VGEAGDTEEEEEEEEEGEEGEELEQEEEMPSEATGEQLPNGPVKSVNSDMTSVRCNKKNWKVLSSSQRARAPLAPALRTHSQQYPSPTTTANATSLTNARVSVSLPCPTRESPPRDADVPSSPPKTNPLDETFEGWPVSPPPTQTIRTSGDEDAVVQVPDSQELNKAHAEPEETHDVVYNEQAHGHASETMGDEVQQPKAEVIVVDVPQDEQQALPDMNDQRQEGDAGMTVGAEGSSLGQTHFPVLPEEAGK
jgi:hypothetical protein